MKAIDFIKSGVPSVLIVIFALVAFSTGYISQELLITFIGLAGFSGLAALRAAISSSGYKTYFVAIGGALVSLGVGVGFVTPEAAEMIFALLGVGALPTLGHANKKTGR